MFSSVDFPLPDGPQQRDELALPQGVGLPQPLRLEEGRRDGGGPTRVTPVTTCRAAWGRAQPGSWSRLTTLGPSPLAFS
jgi:hypothetical protein